MTTVTQRQDDIDRGLGEREFLLNANVEEEIKDNPEFTFLKQIIDVVNSGKVHCGSWRKCATMKRSNLRYWRHSLSDVENCHLMTIDKDGLVTFRGGVSVPGESLPVELYNHCHKCGYDTSYPHILSRVMDDNEWACNRRGN